MRLWPMVAAIAAAGAMNVSAADGEPQAGAAACVAVEVNGERAPSYACLTQKLLPGEGRQARRPDSGLGSDAIVQRPSNQLGLYNHAATSHRMGNTFGTSVLPQRPAAQPPSAPLIPGALP